MGWNDLEKVADTSHISRYPRTNEHSFERASDILRRQNDTVGSSFATIVKNTIAPGIDYKFVRSLHSRKINQYVNLNITNRTYESENSCFCPNGSQRNELMRVRIVGRRRLNVLREKVCSIERNYFPNKKRITRRICV